MSRLRLVLRVGGVLAAALGLLCLPIGFGINPKRDLSIFATVVDLGAFIDAAFILIALGFIALAVSRFLPDGGDEL